MAANEYMMQGQGGGGVKWVSSLLYSSFSFLNFLLWGQARGWQADMEELGNDCDWSA